METEVGVIPEDWDVVDLDAVCTMKSGESITSKRIDNCSPYPCYGGNGLRGFTTCYTHDGSFALIGRQGALCGNVVPAEGKFFASEHAVVVSARKGVDIRWLTYVLGRMNLNRYSESSAQPGLSVSKVLKLPVVLPPMESEQCAIATVLSDADALLVGLNRLIAKKRDLKQAVMQQLLTGETRLPGHKGEWKTMLVGEIGTTYAGLTGKTKSDFGVGQARYVTFLSVLENVVIDPNRSEQVHVEPGECQNRVRCGDILFNGTSETPDDLAMAAVVQADEENVYLNSFCFGFKIHNPSENLSLFLAYYFRGPSGRRIMRSLAQGATRYNVSKNQFLALSLSLPPCDEQRAIASILSDIDAEITALEARRKKTKDIKQAMMQELLTGKTRL